MAVLAFFCSFLNGVKLCPLQVMESTHISSPHIVSSKATRGLSMNPHSIIMMEVFSIYIVFYVNSESLPY